MIEPKNVLWLEVAVKQGNASRADFEAIEFSGERSETIAIIAACPRAVPSHLPGSITPPVHIENSLGTLDTVDFRRQTTDDAANFGASSIRQRIGHRATGKVLAQDNRPFRAIQSGNAARRRECEIASREKVEKRGFALYVGGGLGAVPHQAELFDEFLPEEELLPNTQAIARVFARRVFAAGQCRSPSHGQNVSPGG